MTTVANKQIELCSRDINVGECREKNRELFEDDLINSSIREFLNQERTCLNGLQLDDEASDVDVDSIFDEINRLSGKTNENKSVEEILKEAEILLSKQSPIKLKSQQQDNNKLSDDIRKKFRNLALIDNISEESTPREMKSKSSDKITVPEKITKAHPVEPSTVELKPQPEPQAEEQELIKYSNTPRSILSPAVDDGPPQFLQQQPSLSSSIYSPTNSYARERALECEISSLQEKLKDTEERFHSIRLQYDALSAQHRDLRETHSHLHDETEKLRLDVKHLNDCANILRSELKSARNDRTEAIRLQGMLQSELEESRGDKKKLSEQCDRDTKIITDLQRQCKEMERILMRKHPDSVSALIVASKSTPASNGEDSLAGRKLLEQRIAQLESDAKEQDLKAQRILTNVQSKFSSVQQKYETHIADLETQVLSLQDINTKLNQKIVQQNEELIEIDEEKRALVNSPSQTIDLGRRMSDVSTSNQSTQTTNSTVSNIAKPSTNGVKKTAASKLNNHGAENDSHLLATIRGMRVDLAIKEKALQRLTRELDECKKTIRKIHREKEIPSRAQSASHKKPYDPQQFTDKATDSAALKETLHKLKLLEFDYKSLHDKRLQDLKTLQAAHERELASCHETVRILQQRLAERDEAYAAQKRRRVPVDYYALKAKVSSLEMRHSEREDRLHLLVEALSKGRLNGILDESVLKSLSSSPDHIAKSSSSDSNPEEVN